MNGPTEALPARVPEGATQAGETPARWAWVEPTVWTPRMVTALERGVKGGTWNAFFAAQGLFSLLAARRALRQPSLR